MSELPPGYRLGLEVCHGASAGDPSRTQGEAMPPPHVDDPLEDVSLGQHTANASRREVDASLMSRGVAEKAFVLITAGNGLRGRIVRYVPEPLDHELDRLAYDNGLHARLNETPEDRREAMRRLVRALRQAFGNGIEADWGVPGGRYQRVLEGIVALENLRANDPALGRFTPFRMDLWAFYAQSFGGNTPDQDAYLAVLDGARTRQAAWPAAELGTELRDPAVDIAVDRLTNRGDVLVGRVTQSPARLPMGKEQIGRALWPLARTHRMLSAMSPAAREGVGRRVLHTRGDAPWYDAARFNDLWILGAQALAAGVDITDPHALAAYHLMSMGAFEQATLLTEADGTVQGYNWSGWYAPQGVDLDAVHTRGAQGFVRGDPPWKGSGRTAAPKPKVLWTDTSPNGALVL
ncbi:lonely Cys domain-containing protein, partial [Streptomyces sp. MCAF7]